MRPDNNTGWIPFPVELTRILDPLVGEQLPGIG
jgi:hypothetical protein